jgi:hypothetical protein
LTSCRFAHTRQAGSALTSSPCAHKRQAGDALTSSPCAHKMQAGDALTSSPCAHERQAGGALTSCRVRPSAGQEPCSASAMEPLPTLTRPNKTSLLRTCMHVHLQGTKAAANRQPSGEQHLGQGLQEPGPSLMHASPCWPCTQPGIQRRLRNAGSTSARAEGWYCWWQSRGSMNVNCSADRWYALVACTHKEGCTVVGNQGRS